MHTTIELPRQVRRAEVRAQSYDEAANTIEVVWTTGSTVRRYDWLSGPYDEALEVTPETVRLDRLNAGASFLNSHNAYDLDDVIGSVVPGSARIEAGRGVATIQLSRGEADAGVVQKIRDGIIRNISAGYIVHAVEKLERDDGSVPVWRVTDWEPVEISAVPVPADPGAQIRSASDPKMGAELHPCRITRAAPPSEEPTMATDTKPGDSGDKRPDAKPASGTGSEVPPNPVNPNDNPDMIQDEVNPKPKDTAKGQTPVVDPGDAHPLPLSEAEQERRLRSAARQAVADERDRVNTITDLAERSGFREIGIEHVRKGTEAPAFRAMLMDKLIEARSADGGPKHTGSAPEPSLIDQRRDDREAGAEWARKALNKAAPARTNASH